MSQSLSKIWTHLIFSTKDRYPFLTEKPVLEQLHAYMSSILRNHECHLWLLKPGAFELENYLPTSLSCSFTVKIG